ncbi:MAG TPA: DUF4387 domain-containing protein [Nakamurella sp.]|jgi:hypothetical protein|nr:DUF4387 domain-containing protein [Nakamurella sp.]
MTKLSELAKTIRSKNAGVDRITFDIIFRENETYTRVKESGAITPDSFAALYRIDRNRITDFILYDLAYAIKITILRDRASGGPGDPDLFGAQQYAPLLDVDIP